MIGKMREESVEISGAEEATTLPQLLDNPPIDATR
jgi:hypothetical protein